MHPRLVRRNPAGVHQRFAIIDGELPAREHGNPLGLDLVLFVIHNIERSSTFAEHERRDLVVYLEEQVVITLCGVVECRVGLLDDWVGLTTTRFDGSKMAVDRLFERFGGPPVTLPCASRRGVPR